uniref:18S rRNA (Guanine-N(7))-methyltransferase n=1 Tax=Syphacia muris TaxID=451379 RepID=A0A0N5AYJ7_9BILA
MSRPENAGPPELFYDESEAAKYTSNSHIISVQSEMADRALELLALPDDEPALLLDIGCGSGLSGDVLSDAGHQWIGVDISSAMLKTAQEDRNVSGDLILKDMGHGLCFRPGTFDGAISISAIQWLCHANSRDQSPRKRLLRFFQSLYGCLGRGARAVFQFYPETNGQSDLITDQAIKAGFSGGLVVDYPNSTKAKKIYLVLMTGGIRQLPKALTSDDGERKCVSNVGRRVFNVPRKGKEKLKKGSKAWIEMKKERAKRKGKEVHETSKYTGRKRKRLF